MGTETVSIRAFKTSGSCSKCLAECKLDDPEATVFSLMYPGMKGLGTSIEVSSLENAKKLQVAFKNCFQAGRDQAFVELRKLIGAR